MRDVHPSLFLAIFAIALLGLALFIPSNGITGHVVREDVCGDGSCLELCDVEENTCTTGVCCWTHWDSGICAPASACESVREHSLYQSLETYQDTVRETPTDLAIDWSRFIFPLLLTGAIITYFVLRRSDRTWRPK